MLNSPTKAKYDNMVEVFKTDVNNGEAAQKLIGQIHENFITYKANFDLEDCDLILRIQCHDGTVCALSIIALLKESGYHAEVLPDDFQPIVHCSPLMRTILLE